MVTLSFAAAVTSRIALGTSILVLPTHNPVVLAKEIATLQHLSGGRFIYGVGTGWYPPEFEATGGTSQQRGRRTDEVVDASIQVLRAPHHTCPGTYHQYSVITVGALNQVPPASVA